jgi:hypothetical protein
MVEPYGTLIFVGLGSLLLQLGKLAAKKWGNGVSTTVVHWGAVVLTGIYLAVTGGFAGIAIPAIPSGADALGWVGFIGQVGVMLFGGAAAIAGSYDLALKRIFGGIRLG